MEEGKDPWRRIYIDSFVHFVVYYVRFLVIQIGLTRERPKPLDIHQWEP
jgi:hypothetical protein